MKKLTATITTSLIIGALLAGAAAPASAKDRRRPTTTITTNDDAAFYTSIPNPAFVGEVAGKATDRKSGIRYVTVVFRPCKASEGACEHSDLRQTTKAKIKIRDMNCNHARTKCSWSANVPSGTGNWRVSARSLDRAGNRSATRTIRINVL